MCIEGGSAGKKIGFTDRPVAFVNKLCCIHGTTAFPKILYHALRSKDFTDQFFLNMTGLIGGVTVSVLKNLTITIPKRISEQQAIADILDRKCSQIDALIANEEQQITKLKAYKQSVITETVTKGLNPDVPMKDSGVEWIGEIPEQWNVAPPKALFRLRTEKAKQTDKQLTASQQFGVVFQEDYMNMTGTRVVVVEKDFSILKHVEKGDFVISMRSFQGGLEYSENTGCISSAYVMLIPNLKYVYPIFYKWLFKSSVYINALQSTSNLVRDGQAMRFANFVQVPLFFIPLSEQKEIADFLAPKCEQIDRLIAIKQQKIEKLQQYKKSVIYEYVTGKRESVDTNVVFFNPLTAKALLLCKIIDFLGDQLRGRIQVLKCLFLIEDCVGINFNTQYFRFKHGPYTPDIVNIEKCCMENEWLTVSIVNNHYEYHIGNNHCYYSDKYDKIFGTNNSEIEKVLSFIKGMKTSEVERVATLFAVWNDMIIAGTNSPSDSEIIFEVRNNWTPNKANSPVSTWQNTLDKMRKAGITPKGYGLHTMKKENENEQL